MKGTKKQFVTTLMILFLGMHIPAFAAEHGPLKFPIPLQDYLASQVPGFSNELKYAVVAGAVAGGGLTVIANAPNPAGLSILSKYFPDGVSPLKLFLGAFVPTTITTLCFILLK